MPTKLAEWLLRHQTEQRVGERELPNFESYHQFAIRLLPGRDQMKRLWQKRVSQDLLLRVESVVGR